MSASVYILALSGSVEAAQAFSESRYPNSEQIILSKRIFHEAGWMQRLHELRKLRGAALVIFFESLLHVDQPRLLICASLFHRCRETVFADGQGASTTYSKGDLLLKIPELVLSGILDVLVVALSWVAIKLLLSAKPKPVEERSVTEADLDIGYLYPFPLQRVTPGGEMSYLKGTLQGFRKEGASCEIFTGCFLPIDFYPVHLLQNRRKFYLLRESQALTYNLYYARVVKEFLSGRKPRILYQRHGRFVVAGALLSRWLKIPLALEYQCSELWRARNWDPGHFLSLIGLCEDLTINSTSIFIALSEVLKDELIARGVHPDKIVINPAAVDSDRFRPGCGGTEVREQLGFSNNAVVVGFVGSFSYYHGIPTLQAAIERLLARRRDNPALASLKFLLIGDGVLRPDMQRVLSGLEGGSDVIFTGSIPHDLIPSHLDACDLLVSPHAPMPDGERFFGSPSKLFEYMAMGKGIVASNLDQLGEVLQHGETAWLVEPGSAAEVADAIELLALNPELRARLGRGARRAVVERHSWNQNAHRFLGVLRGPEVLVATADQAT